MVTIFARAMALAMSACSSIPTAGPTTSQVIDQATKPVQPAFSLVELNPEVILAASGSFSAVLPPKFAAKPPAPTIGVGDTISVTIWQRGVPGLLVSPPAATNPPGASPSGNGLPGQIIVPDQVVSIDGGVTVPFAGRVRVAGRTILRVQKDIERALSENLLTPEVLVTVPKSMSAMATVSGETLGGVRVPISPSGERLLDVIAAAGGAKAPIYETEVKLTRRGDTVSIPMESIVLDPATNIFVWPGDSITLVHAPKTFSVFGATQNNSLLPFNASSVNLAQAIARAGGLQDARADPAGVFLFRFESSGVASAVGAQPSIVTPAGVPIIYHLNLQQVGSYFLATRFRVKNEDVIYVAGASLNDVQKFFTLISSVTVPILSGAVLAK